MVKVPGTTVTSNWSVTSLPVALVTFKVPVTVVALESATLVPDALAV